MDMPVYIRQRATPKAAEIAGPAWVFCAVRSASLQLFPDAMASLCERRLAVSSQHDQTALISTYREVLWSAPLSVFWGVGESSPLDPKARGPLNPPRLIF